MKTNKKINPWMIISITLFIIMISYALWYTINLGESEEDFKVEMCKSISVSPSWALEDGRIVDTGYKNFTNETETNVVRDYLIPNKVYFLYRSNCGWCEKQIQEFGEEWELYEESGYTIDCQGILG